ncbi:MAG: hypothetical protein JOZ72_14655 [Alphaproteobacteria bacterium]|nr:hypothetical protein [Alphaproteobacteria bacterium]
MAALLVCAVAGPAQANWRILKDHWSAEDEAGFGRFVAALGESNCSSSQSCLRDPANPYRKTDQNFLDIDVDCAKWPYLLRAYYAWKNNLPFSYVDGVSGEGGDLRFTKSANHPTGRHDIIDRGGGIDAPAAIMQMLGSVFSGTYRTDAGEERGVQSDFYSPAMQPGTIRPGSLIYDVNGHVAIAYKVDQDGRIFYMDAHPDFTVTRSVYGAQFGQSPARLGGGLKNWRPFKLIGAHKDAAGHLMGGRMAFAQNGQIADFSLVQYSGTEPNPKQDIKKARFVYNGAQLGFYEYVRVAVSGGRMELTPLYELQATMKTLCNDLKDRAQYVDLDVKDGISVKNHASRLPDNIYGSDDKEWEEYSTPSRDARIKTAFAQFYKDMQEMIALWVARDPRIVYDGFSLQKDMSDTYQAQSQACTITYLSSDKKPVAMTFDDMMRRLFKISFDPYHCIELRWGAEGAERASCPDGKAKLKWYEAEQRLRNQPDRTYDLQMGFDLDELGRHVKGSGLDAPPPVDIKALIDAMPNQVAFQPMKPGDR